MMHFRPLYLPLLLLLHLLLLTVGTTAFEFDFGPRTWTNADGRELTAQLVSADDVRAELKLATTGKTVPVPLASLSEKDHEYIAAWIEARKITWGFELLDVDYPSSFRTKPRGDDPSTRQTIRPMMGEPDDILLLLTLKVTPPPDVAASYFDAPGMILKVKTEEGLTTASVKYIVPPDPREKAAEDGSVERSILYQVPKGAKPAEIKYRDNPVIGL